MTVGKPDADTFGVIDEVQARLLTWAAGNLSTQAAGWLTYQLRMLALLLERDAAREEVTRDGHEEEGRADEGRQEGQQGLLSTDRDGGSNPPGCGACNGPWVAVAGGGRTIAHAPDCRWWARGW